VRVLGVIPARYGSTRFEGKVLASLRGRPLLLHAVENARASRRLDRLVVAVDDPRVERVAAGAGVEVVTTPGDLPSGSDRAAWTARRLEDAGDAFDAVVNFQADEPFLPGEAVDRAVAALEGAPEAAMATLAAPAGRDVERDPHAVKVALDKRGRALYFSRSPVPHGGLPGEHPYLRHIGLYVFRRGYLDRFTALGPSALERAERLEQLRALEDGAAIMVAVGAWPAIGVDTPEDLERAERGVAEPTLARRRTEP
jgi:3-deoxy-manno-octulosonate cytidylyltransferase (CMP-KDO synthetase)